MSAHLSDGRAERSAGTVPTSSQRTRSPRNTGPSTHERTIPGDAVVADDRQDAGHADADAAGHDSSTAHWVGIPRRRATRHRPEHAHRAARVDTSCRCQPSAQHVGHDALGTGRAVVGGDRNCRRSASPRGPRTPVRARRAEHGVDPGPAGPQASARPPAARRRTRRRPGSRHAAVRVPGRENGRPSGPTRSTGCAGAPRPATPCPHRAPRTHLDGASVTPVAESGRSRTPGAAPCPVRSPPTARATKWPGRMARRSPAPPGQVVVGPGPPEGQHLPA